MKQKPPYYTVDHETQRYLELITLWARQLGSVQVNHTDIPLVVDEICERFGLMLDEPQENLETADIHHIRPFRVISTTKTDETEDETRCTRRPRTTK